MQRSFEWGGVYQKNPSRRKLLEDLLPDHYNYKIEEFQPIAESHIFCESKFSAVFCVNCCSIEDCNKFFDDMKTLSNTDYNKTSHPDKFNLKKFKMTFYGRGDRGPQLIMTDDAEAEKKSLR